MLEPGMPPHLRLCGEERKRLMGSDKEPVTDFGLASVAS